MSGGGSSDRTKKCGLFELIVFVSAIVFGTACSILSKTMMSLHGKGKTGELEQFEKPIFQSKKSNERKCEHEHQKIYLWSRSKPKSFCLTAFGMFLGMCFGLVMHYIVCWFRIPFPGYTHGASASNGVGTASSERSSLLAKKDGIPTENSGGQQSVPTWMYFFLAIPAIFDLGATALCMMGLRYIDVSIYQLLRGSGESISMDNLRYGAVLSILNYRSRCPCFTFTQESSLWLL